MKCDMSKMRDHFWVWGHPEGKYNHLYGNEDESRMTPMEGALYMGARNMFMVPVGVPVNWRQYNKSFVTLQNVGWCIDDAAVDPKSLEKLIEEAKSFPNITCAVFDDFQIYLERNKVPVEKYRAVHERLHNNGVRTLDMWMVLYTHEFGVDAAHDEWFKDYIDCFDGVIMWTWKASDLRDFEEKYAIFKKQTEGKRRMLGLYLYNFGENGKASAEDAAWQLERYSDLLRRGEIEGIVLHTNTMADLDHPAYDVETAWMKEHGDEEI